MEEYTQAPPEGLWETVEAGLPAKTAGFPWMWALAGAAAAVLAVVLLQKPADAPTANLRAEADPVEILPDAPLGQNDSDSSVILSDATVILSESEGSEIRSLTAFARNDKKAPAQNVAPEILPDAPLGQNDSDADATVTPDENPVAEDDSAVKPDESPVAETDPVEILPDAPIGRSDSEVNIVRKKTTRPTLTASLIAGTIPGSAADSYTSFGVAHASAPGAASIKTGPVAVLSRNRPTTNEVRHSVAMRVGAMFNLSFSEHWGVETGLQLSNLQTQTKSVTGDMTYVTDKTISYVGVPLLAVYTPFRVGNFAFYASAGPMFEYGFHSFGKEESYIGKERLTQDKIEGRESDAILSLGLNMGAQWMFWDLGGLFFQPGLSWHIVGEGNTESFYTAHPLSFAFAAGFRFNF